jgi:hypothetical protein
MPAEASLLAMSAPRSSRAMGVPSLRELLLERASWRTSSNV